MGTFQKKASVKPSVDTVAVETSVLFHVNVLLLLLCLFAFQATGANAKIRGDIITYKHLPTYLQS